MSLSFHALSASVEIKTQGGFYKAILRETVIKNGESALVDLYKDSKSPEIQAPTSEGTIGRKVILNNGQNFRIACVCLDNFKTSGTKEFHCDFMSERFDNNFYEVEYIESNPKELHLTFHAENARDLITRLGLSNNVSINIGNKVELFGDDQTLSLSITE